MHRPISFLFLSEGLLCFVNIGLSIKSNFNFIIDNQFDVSTKPFFVFKTSIFRFEPCLQCFIRFWFQVLLSLEILGISIFKDFKQFIFSAICCVDSSSGRSRAELQCTILCTCERLVTLHSRTIRFWEWTHTISS